MTAATPAGRALDDLSRLSGDQQVLRLAIAAAPLAVLACAWAAGAAVAVWVVVLVLLPSAPCVVRPDGHAGLCLTAVLGWHWVMAVDDPATAWALPAALALMTLHTAIAAAAAVPGAAVLDRLARRAGRAAGQLSQGSPRSPGASPWPPGLPIRRGTRS